MQRVYKTIKENAQALLATYIVIGGLYGLGMTLNGFTTGHVSADYYLGKKQPHAELCRKIFGRIPEDIIRDTIMKKLEE